MVYYLDSSAVLRWLLKAPGYFADYSKWSKSVSSALLRVECNRTLGRLRLENRINDAEVSALKMQLQNILESIFVVGIQDSIIERASESFPTVIKSLDAIHLATLIIIQNESDRKLTLVTHDDNMIIAGTSLGISIYH